VPKVDPPRTCAGAEHLTAAKEHERQFANIGHWDGERHRAWPALLTLGRCIGALGESKLLCNNDLASFGGVLPDADAV
jgi:hypothetical protein